MSFTIINSANDTFYVLIYLKFLTAKHYIIFDQWYKRFCRPGSNHCTISYLAQTPANKNPVANTCLKHDFLVKTTSLSGFNSVNCFRREMICVVACVTDICRPETYISTFLAAFGLGLEGLSVPVTTPCLTKTTEHGSERPRMLRPT